MLLRTGRLATAVLVIGLSARLVRGQTPVFEDPLTDAGKTTGQWGSGVFSADGYRLTQSGGTDPEGHPRSVDFVWYDLPGVGSDGSGTIECDVAGLFPNAGVIKNELMVGCDSTGLRPATTGDHFYSSACSFLLRKDNYTPGDHVNKMKISAGVAAGSGFEARTAILPWAGTTTYRFRVTWSGTTMRAYRGLPDQVLTLLSPPTPYNFGVSWSPGILHVQLGSTFRAGPRGVADSGGAPGTLYSCLRVYEEDIGNVATPPRGWQTGVSIDLGTTDRADGLTRVIEADGDTAPATIGGRDARRNQDPGNDYYFYFNVHDLFAYQGNKPNLYIMVDYYDAGFGSLSLQYDAADGTVYKAGGSVALTGANTWKQHAYHVTDAYFGNRQNGGADFRIFGGVNNVFYLDVVQVSVVSPLPPKASNPSPAHQATRVSINADLSWAQAERATSYDVYFGLTSPPGFRENQVQTTFTPGAMAPLTTYFWRIDTVNSLGTTPGDTWRFTTVTYPGDFDGDLDVDQSDFGHSQACFTGSGVHVVPGCEDTDFDLDGDADQADFLVFQQCMSGANTPADPNCAD